MNTEFALETLRKNSSVADLEFEVAKIWRARQILTWPGLMQAPLRTIRSYAGCRGAMHYANRSSKSSRKRANIDCHSSSQASDSWKIIDRVHMILRPSA